MEPEALARIEQITGYKFSDHLLLDKAFTQSSAVSNRFQSNERLEFFGDSVLGMVICQILFERFPAYLEGDLTKIKSMLVSRRTCAKLTNQLGLGEFLQIGKGMANSKALKGSLAAGLLEAVIAAIYVDGGFEVAKDFVLRVFEDLIKQADAEQSQGNYKSVLQQYSQQQLGVTPHYELLDEKGPDHDKCFESEVVTADRHFPSAWGTTKKEAEQKAAFNALVELGLIRDDAVKETPA